MVFEGNDINVCIFVYKLNMFTPWEIYKIDLKEQAGMVLLKSNNMYFSCRVFEKVFIKLVCVVLAWSLIWIFDLISWLKVPPSDAADRKPNKSKYLAKTAIV